MRLPLFSSSAVAESRLTVAWPAKLAVKSMTFRKSSPDCRWEGERIRMRTRIAECVVKREYGDGG